MSLPPFSSPAAGGALRQEVSLRLDEELRETKQRNAALAAKAPALLQCPALPLALQFLAAVIERSFWPLSLNAVSGRCH